MATLVRWDPFREVAALHSELSRLMNNAFEGPVTAKQSWVPTLDVWETEDALVYAFDLPGVEEGKVSIEVEDAALTVTAERERSEEVSQERYHRFERRYGSFRHTVGLPQGVDADAISASFANGVLEIRVPKPAEAKPRRIEIAVGDRPKTIEGSAEQK
jgi:HSP20 family protein